MAGEAHPFLQDMNATKFRAFQQTLIAEVLLGGIALWLKIDPALIGVVLAPLTMLAAGYIGFTAPQDSKVRMEALKQESVQRVGTSDLPKAPAPPSS